MRPSPKGPPDPRPGVTANGAHLIGEYGGTEPGPTFLVAAGIHGNEPAGIAAARRTLDDLRARRPRFRGRFVALVGNLTALEGGVRFVDLDLNRIWTRQRIRELESRDPAALRTEDREQLELWHELEPMLEATGFDPYFLDLHTSSAPGKPFVCIGDTLRNRDFALRIPAPVILGLEEQIDGALLEYVNDCGGVTMGVEGGQHDSDEAVDFIEAVVGLALLSAGCVDEADLPAASRFRALLRRETGELPPALEVRHRHPVEPGDGFEMEPGYANFQPVRRGELLARDARGPIVARENGRVLLPLYQGQGSDGFFLIREFSPFWLRVSATLRRLSVDRWVRWLPGVRHHPDRSDDFVVDPSVARWLAPEVFHLLGFRKRRSDGRFLVFSRRRHDRLPRGGATGVP